MTPPARRDSIRARMTPRWVGVLAVLAAVMAGAGVVYSEVIRPQLTLTRFGTVVEGKIYRSGETTPGALERAAKAYGIRTIVDLGAYEPGGPDDRREQRTADALGITRYRFNLHGDATGNPNYYVQALRIMTDPAKQPVLVHCAAGAQRTGCTVLLYRHLVEGWDVERAYQETQSFDHSFRRNPRLLTMVAQHKEAIARALREGTTIPGVEAVPEPTPVPRAE